MIFKNLILAFFFKDMNEVYLVWESKREKN